MRSTRGKSMNISFKNALVTGGAGFIGSHLVEVLLALGCRVKVLDNLSTGNLLNLEPVKDDIIFLKNDIRDLEALEKAAEGCEVIFHLAAVVAVQQTISNPVIDLQELATTVRVRQGDSVVLAGLISQIKNLEHEGVPWFNKIPYFGNLFNHIEQTEENRELVIVITPYVMENS